MRFDYRKGEGITFHFPTNELCIALEILKSFRPSPDSADLFLGVIHELEEELYPRPRLVPQESRFHFCEECAREIDTQSADGNYLLYKKGDIEKWKHQVCPPLPATRTA